MKRETLLRALVAGSIASNVVGAGLAAKVLIDRGGIEYIQRRLGVGSPTPAVPYEHRLAALRLVPDVPDEVVFLGDSLTEAFRWSECFPGLMVQNHGLGGNRVADVLSRLGEITSRRPAVVFLNIGTNDIGDLRTPGEIARDVAQVVDRLSLETPGTRVVLTDVPPRRGPAYAEPIAELNGLLAGIAEERGLERLDLYATLVGADGQIAPRFTTDGVHLSAAAYEVWIDAASGVLGSPGTASTGSDGSGVQLRMRDSAG